MKGGILIQCTIIVLVAVATLPQDATVSAAAGTPPPCLTVAYTVDENSNLSTYATNGSIMVGNYVIIESSCGDFDIYLDGNFRAGGSYQNGLQISEGRHSIEAVGENWSMKWVEMDFFPGSEMWIGEPPGQDNIIEVSSSEVWWDEMIAHGITVIIIYFVTTSLVYRVAQWRVDRAVEVVV